MSRLTGTINGDYGLRDPFDASRTSGVLDADRRHILNLSWNAFLPDAAHGPLDRALGRRCCDGWQLSGISTFASGVPLRLGFSGDAAGPGVSQAYFGTPDVVGTDTWPWAAKAMAWRQRSPATHDSRAPAQAKGS